MIMKNGLLSVTGTICKSLRVPVNNYRPLRRMIMHLVASDCLSVLSRLSSLTLDLYFWHGVKYRKKNGYYQSKKVACVSVIRGLMRIILQTRSNGFQFYDVISAVDMATCISSLQATFLVGNQCLGKL